MWGCDAKYSNCRPGVEQAEQPRDILRAFFNIARDWGLNTDEQMVLLGAPGRSTFFKWKSAPETADLKRDTLERLS
jgi:hypothetical protein